MIQRESGIDVKPHKLPNVVFVILNWNQGEITAECLESLQALTYPNYGVVVVDNGSTDGSQKIISSRFPNITLIENGINLGFSEGNNVGIKYALLQCADYVLLLNNDTVVSPDFLNELVEVAESDPRIGVTTPKIYYFGGKCIWCAGAHIDWRSGKTFRLRAEEIDGLMEEEIPCEVNFVSACCMLVKRCVL